LHASGSRKARVQARVSHVHLHSSHSADTLKDSVARLTVLGHVHAVSGPMMTLTCRSHACGGPGVARTFMLMVLPGVADRRPALKRVDRSRCGSNVVPAHGLS